MELKKELLLSGGCSCNWELSSPNRSQSNSSSDAWGRIESGPVSSLIFALQIKIDSRLRKARNGREGKRGARERKERREHMCVFKNPEQDWVRAIKYLVRCNVKSALTISVGRHLEVISVCDYLWTATLVGSLLTSKHRPRARKPFMLTSKNKPSGCRFQKPEAGGRCEVARTLRLLREKSWGECKKKCCLPRRPSQSMEKPTVIS